MKKWEMEKKIKTRLATGQNHMTSKTEARNLNLMWKEGRF